MIEDFKEQLKKHACDWIDNNIDSLLESLLETTRYKYAMVGLDNAVKYLEKGRDAYIAKLEAELDNQSRRNLIQSLELNEDPNNILNMCNLLDTKIADLNLSTRTNNGLIHANIITLGDACKMNKLDFLKIKGFGRKCLVELDDCLEALNLHFDMDVEKYYSALYKLSKI